MKIIDENNNEIEDLIGIKESIDAFTAILNSTSYKVYGVVGNWGIGKTTFIKNWEKTLSENNYIHVNAFEYDYESNAFLVLLSMITEALKRRNKTKEDLKEMFQVSKEFLLNSFKATGKIVVNAIVKKATGSDDLDDLVKDYFDAYFDDLLSKNMIESNYHEKLTHSIEKITKSLSEPIYLVIDELDRCRPIFALEMMEKVKHIFGVENIRFILVYNKEILKKVIEKEYGMNSGGDIYLQKFIEKEINYVVDKDLSRWMSEELNSTKERFISELLRRFLVGNVLKLVEVQNAHNLSFRQMSRVITRLRSYPGTILSDDQCTTVTTYELMKMVNLNELDDMIDYVRRNGGFSSNLPVKFNYDSIYRRFLNINGQISTQIDYNFFYRYYAKNI